MTGSSEADRPLAILGATASGKSGLALALAKRLGNVELVSIDSMQVYDGMNVGTATPTLEEQAQIPHHLINLVAPDEAFTVGEFQRHARAALAGIRSRGKVPVLVGGTGLYLRSVIDDLELPPQFLEARAAIESEPDTEALHARLAALDPVAADRMEPTNRRRVVRALEVCEGSGRAFSSFGPGMEVYPPTPYVQLAIRWERTELDRRIAERYEQQMDAGFLNEVRWLNEVGPSRTAAQALGYRELLSHVRGETSLEGALNEAVRRTVRFARRQERWFRRDPRITWIDAPVDVDSAIEIWTQVRETPAS
ncbi:MAG: tRNA (adenosine(37)-N6)-dimethylallyltransferase MiaA [Acidimicrobiaceae bacterium]|jgi:tRNA dimethylallyltransferase|nr:tRNA (adenosine(37)-N6)-dimethylallyltransferase MiaA [Acidimicrobiaceae bacterium]MBT5581026.1 tRNA (adenosine(37)-N6)-dimethylallyltransferase MiaA [Acidimicrobiaceae bacterium]MBT5851065.1 tRNA (adenosine(37)-N6)-dimethylallyltransferase MiaA [Acidimicrobiaceae bacterium]